MISRTSFRNLALAGAMTLALVSPALADPLPRLEADSMGGTHVVLPNAANGKPLVLLLAFTQEAKDDMKKWSKKLLDEKVAENDAVYVVIVADNTAFFAHKKIRKLVQDAAVGTPDQLNNNVLLTFSGNGWKTLTPPGDKHTAGVVVVDAGGNIVLAKREPYSDANFAEVLRDAK